MPNIIKLLDLYRDKLSELPKFNELGMKKKHINLAFNPQNRNTTPYSFPEVNFVYDYDRRNTWANIANLVLIINVEVKEFEQARDLTNEIQDFFHEFLYSDPCVIVYKSFFAGGDPMPVINPQRQTYETVLEFEIAFG